MFETSVFDYKPFLKNLTTRPGVYQMFDDAGKVIYVGKAKNLKNRVSSYFRANSSLAAKTQALVSQIENIEITVTHTEAEALLLESNLIKKIRPRYNILLKDDKSYPYIRVSHAEYPRISFYRGARKKDADYFGPYPNVLSVKESLNLLQKVFKVRPCNDSYFAHRSRPCLQYQIKRCSAPCVNLITHEQYQKDIQNTKLFLAGKSGEVVENLIAQMDKAAQNLDYESAAVYRDQIRDMQKVSEQQYMNVSGDHDIDIVSIERQENMVGVHVHFVRGGQSLGGKNFFPSVPKGRELEDVLEQFLVQYYMRHPMPKEVVLSHKLDNKKLIEEALTLHKSSKVFLNTGAREEKRKWLVLAATNIKQALTTKLASKESMAGRFDSLMNLLEIDEWPKRMECFDISHTSGEATVASCVVFDQKGPNKSQYRRFNITDITGGDDYAAMHQALSRRFSRAKKESSVMPDVLFIDGGKGQVAQAEAVLSELDIDQVLVVGVAKGPERIAGEEVLIMPHLDKELQVSPDTPGLHLIQQIRDEAHRFAITGHRDRRAKARKRSVLEEIPGIGAKKRQDLLKRFGGIQGIMQASVDELEKVPGISAKLAEDIYGAFNPEK